MNCSDVIRSSDVANIIKAPLNWEHLSGEKILVTGASGFIGTYLVQTLLALNNSGKLSRPVEVVAMVRNANTTHFNAPGFADNPYFSLMHWDLNQISVPNIKNCSYILHAASQASPRLYGPDPVGTLLPNTVGTAALLEALKSTSAAKAFLFISSSEVYGTPINELPLEETNLGYLDTLASRSCYAESKRMGEAMCMAWFRQHNIPSYITRLFHTYGPGLQEDDGRVFADFSFNVLRNEPITITGTGHARRAFCYISDAISGIFTVLLSGRVAQPYNVANPYTEMSIYELARLLANLYPEKKLEVIGSKPNISKIGDRISPDISRLTALGWTPTTDASTGFRRMIDSYQK